MHRSATRLHSPMVVYFDAIRRAGSIREAARRLNVASSAVNRQLLKLEAELGTPLFDRFPTGLKLTHAGSTFARHAIEVLQDAERVRSEVEALKGLRTGHVEIGAIEEIASSILPRVLVAFHELYPRISVGINILGSTSVTNSLTSGDIDLGVAFNLDRARELSQLSSSRFHLGAVMRPDHPLAQHNKLAIPTCMAHRVIMPKASFMIGQPLLRYVAELPAGSVDSQSYEVAKQLALLGEGITFMTRIGIETEIAEGKLVHVPIRNPAPLRTDLGVYVRSARNPPVAVHAFSELLSTALKGPAEREPPLS